MTTHVIIGASSWRDYIFDCVPAALLWRDLVGFHPIVLRTGNWATPKRGVTVLEALEHHKIDHHHVGEAEGYTEITLAQNCRQHAGCLDLPDSDWAMPSDADLWPIRASYYKEISDWGICYNANMDHYSTLPTCHVALPLAIWRELYRVKVGDNVAAAIKSSLDPWLETYRERWPWTDRGFAVWMSDQAMMTDKLRAQPWYNRLKMVERSGCPGPERIDRDCWPKGDYDISKFIDAHVHRAPDQDPQWADILALFGKLLPQHVEWFKAYREEFIKGY